jgi:hypothetical protein
MFNFDASKVAEKMNMVNRRCEPQRVEGPHPAGRRDDQCLLMDWRHFRQQSFLSLAIIMASAVVVSMLLPNMDLRGALITIAFVALLLGWMP